jgi:tetratricopeptide (TPR) repeat protein
VSHRVQGAKHRRWWVCPVTMSAPEPIATGNLAKTALPHLLVYLEQKRLSGTLAIWPDPDEQAGASRPDRILLLKGCPVAATLIEPATNLREGLLSLFIRTRAAYAFYGTNLLGDDRLSARVEPFSLIAESLRGATRDDVVQEVLQRFATAKLRLLPDVDLARYELQPDERDAIDRLQAEPATVQAFADDAAGGASLPAIRRRRLMYLLAITKAVEPMAVIEPRPVSGPVQSAALGAAESHAANEPQEHADAEPGANDASARPSVGSHDFAAGFTTQAGGSSPPLHAALDRLQHIPPPPAELSDEMRQRWLRIVTKGRLIENQNHFEMLDLDKDVKSNEARAKFLQIAKEWHPDRLPPELAALRDYVQIIFSYMSDANATLGDDNQRAKYVQSVREGGGTPATDKLMQAILDTAMEYERVLILSRRHQYDEALELMRKILHVVKEDAEYYFMDAWLLMQKHAGQTQDVPLKQMLESVDKALQLYDRHEKANLLKGQILRRMGRKGEALTFFKKVAEINPRNIDAMREVRVATMRAGSSPDTKTKRSGEIKRVGLLSKLFKKE